MNDNFLTGDTKAAAALRADNSDVVYRTLHEAWIAWDRLSEKSKDGATITCRGITYASGEINRMSYVKS